MSVMTHESKWPLLVGAAPLVGVAFFIWAAAQGEADVARSVTARAILAGVAALGAAVAWWTGRQLRIAAALPVSRAGALAQSGRLAGAVALHGRARALPDSAPLVSPDGELCLWFRTDDDGPRRDSVRPFLLVDDSGECIVLPAGADVTGHGPVPAAAARSGLGDDVAAQEPETPGRLLRNGDRVHVTGRFVAASPESLVLQARAAPPLAHHGLLLPVIAAPEGGQPLRIHIGSDDGDGGVYGVLAVVDCLVLLVSSSLAAWSVFMPG
ncbi:MAG: hypothetical protein ACJ8GJ_23380 [Vitreoscilla sp.]